MIKLEHVVLASPEQMDFIIEGMRNPMNSWDKSDTNIDPDMYSLENIDIVSNDLSLMQQLSKAGTDHRKYMRMMPVFVRVTAPLYWWYELDTYNFGTVANSCSTMHKIQAKEFTIDDFSTEIMYRRTLRRILGYIKELNYWRDVFLNGGGKDIADDIDPFDDENNEWIDLYLDPKAKKAWWQMIQLLHISYNQTRNVMLNYEVLANIYKSRRNIKLDEWREFCKWIESLPYSWLITGVIYWELDTSEYAKEHPDFAEKIIKMIC